MRKAVTKFAGDVIKAAISAFDEPVIQSAKPYHSDGWQNLLTGFGTARDKMTAASFEKGARLSDYEIQSLFDGDDVAYKVVSLRPKEMFRRGYRLEIKPRSIGPGSDRTDDDSEFKLERYATRLELNNKVRDAMIQGRLFGGAILVAGLDDGRNVADPLNEKAIRSIKYLSIVDRRDLRILSYFDDPLEPQFNEPELYEILGANGKVTVIHASRCIKFEGQEVDERRRRELDGWTYSVLQRPYDRLLSFGTSFQAISNLLADLSQGVFKINGLMDMISSGEAAKVQTRMMLVDQMRSASRSLVLDTEMEDFDRIATPLSGLPETFDRLMMCVSAAVDIPISLLFGRSAAGQNATGDLDFRSFYDTIASGQKNDLKPQLLKLYSWIVRAKDAQVSLDPEALDIEFFPLWEPSELEQAQSRWQLAQSDNAYIMNGTLSPEEVAISRFGAGRWSMETTINVKSRQEAVDNMESFDPHENDPEEPAEQQMNLAGQPTTKAAAGGDPAGPQVRPSNAKKA